ncbi:archaeosine biosynthesis radical SAM protein RaSEA [Geoglobus ahangari]
MKAWVEKERLHGEVVDCLTIILPTRGCAWDSCHMCSYTLDSRRDASQEEVYGSFLKALERGRGEVLKIFTSGSFFDDREVSGETRRRIYEKALEEGFRKLVVESRPEFVREEIVEEIEEAGIEVEVGIGLETSSDEYRSLLINKGFTFQDFVRASEMLRRVARVKAYLLMKPPLLTEREAIEDVLRSIRDVKGHADIVSLNLMTVHRKTLVERLWQRGAYRPPWLWSAVEVLKNADMEIVCDPVAGGKSRGPHNCFKCDERVAEEIRRFSLTQDKGVFETECECRERWELSLEAERLTDIFLFP